MDDALRTALEGLGWTNVYTNFLPQGHAVKTRANGIEHEGLSPYPGSTDKVPSWAFNSVTGYWNDMHYGPRLPGAKKNGGNIVQHVAYMMADLTPEGKLLVDFHAAERELRVFAGLSSKVDEAWLSACRMRVSHEGSRFQHLWQQHKPLWTSKLLTQLGVGWDEELGRMVIPILDRKGRVVNCRVYRPGPGDGVKMRWLLAGVGPQNLPFPASMSFGKTGGTVWLVEGEPDVITLLALNIRAVSGTYGAMQPVPYLGPDGAEWTRQTNVIVCMDADPAGEKAASDAVAGLQRYVASIRRVNVPSWPGAPPKRDISNYIAHLVDEGMSREQIKTHLVSIASLAEPAGADAAYDSEPVDMGFDDAVSPNNLGVRSLFRARVIAVQGTRHMALYGLTMSCRRNLRVCERCEFRDGNGSVQLTIDHRSHMSMALTMAPDEQASKLLKQHFNIPPGCTECRFEPVTAMDVQIVQLGPPLHSDNMMTIAAEDANSRRIEAQVVTASPVKIEAGQDYILRGFVYPSPRNQKAVMQLDKADLVADMADGAPMPEEDAERIRITLMPPGMGVKCGLVRRAEDMARGVTGIRGRPDMHIAMMLCFHNAFTFSMGGEHVARGWIDYFLLGDTRCGKSAAFKAMCNYFATGAFVDCKMQSIPGLLGAVEQSAITGERFVVPGIVPLADRRGPVGFDEFTGARYGRTSILEAMSSTRAEGRVTINKAAHATFYARVSTIWMANPGMGQLLADLPGYGVERIKALVMQPEDIARFDIAQVVTQQDVAMSELMRPTALAAPNLSIADAQMLVRWGRSRRHEDFHWTDEAVDVLVDAATRMIRKYDSSIPLIEGATTRHKIGKIATAIAVMLFSSDDRQRVIVTPDHVIEAYALLLRMYDSPNMEYGEYSRKRIASASLRDPQAIESMLSKELGQHMYSSLYALLRVDSFTPRTFGVICTGALGNTQGVMSALAAAGCIEAADGREMFKLTKAFVGWITAYLKSCERKAAENREDNVGTKDGETAAG